MSLGALLGFAAVASACAATATTPTTATPTAKPTPKRTLAPPPRAAPQAPALSPSRLAALRAVLEDARDGDERRAVGAAWIDGESAAFVTLGPRGHEGDAPLDADTVFPLGSVSKVFASVLLAEALRRHEIASLDEPVSSAWRDAAAPLSIPRGATREITWEDLASYRAGFPFFPTNWKPGTAEHRAGYTLEEFRTYLASATLDAEPGAKAIYGNTGFGVLALGLAEIGRRSFGDLLRTRIFAPLEMTDSGFPDHDEQPPADFLEGYDEKGRPEPWKWDPSPMAPCCVVRSSLRDMARFAREAMRPESTWRDDLALVGRPRTPAPWGMGDDFGLGIFARHEGETLFKDGQVHGVRTFVVFEPATRRALVVVVSSYRVDVGDLGWRAWDAARGDPSGDLTTSEEVASAPDAATPLNVALSDAVVARSIVAPESARPGETVTVSLYLACTAASSARLRVYSDLWMGPHDGRVVRTQLLAPASSGCAPGRVFRHDLVYTLPRSDAMGRADVWVGLTSVEPGTGGPDAATHGEQRRRVARIAVVPHGDASGVDRTTQRR